MIAWRLQWRVSPLFAPGRYPVRAADPNRAPRQFPELGKRVRAPPLDGETVLPSQPGARVLPRTTKAG
jgi:hypothetical protein